jgi:hypothetical protein
MNNSTFVLFGLTKGFLLDRFAVSFEAPAMVFFNRIKPSLQTRQ